MTSTASWWLVKYGWTIRNLRSDRATRRWSAAAHSQPGRRIVFHSRSAVTLQVNEERFVAKAGMFANIPVGCLHCFKNETDQPAKDADS